MESLRKSCGEVDLDKMTSQDYEEISIPIPPPPLIGPKEHRVEIADLDGFAQRGFKGYKSLNRVQSIVYETAYMTNENMLICAPTGAVSRLIRLCL